MGTDGVRGGSGREGSREEPLARPGSGRMDQRVGAGPVLDRSEIGGLSSR
jgi:hypothetical protein